MFSGRVVRASSLRCAPRCFKRDAFQKKGRTDFMTDDDFLKAMGVKSFPTDQKGLRIAHSGHATGSAEEWERDREGLLEIISRQSEQICKLRFMMEWEQGRRAVRLGQECRRADRWRMVAVVCTLALLVAGAYCISR
jgi:hypothetical protein